ncbi:DUF4913 domain-containing protein [Plantibacter sp. CFBP 13570]|nr:DUF4913 domain-containing protein [Plantibacter sp. CFBP 13570]
MREEVSGLALEAAQSTLQPDDNTPEPESSGDVDGADEPPKETLYASVDEFVRKSLNDLYRRPVGSAQLWAPNWWAYPEALSRLEALWRAWEHLRLDGATGMSVWWKDHADHHMSVLMSPSGPFGDVHNVRTNPNEPLPYAAPPEGLFPPDKYVEPDIASLANEPTTESWWCPQCGSENGRGVANCAECTTRR